MRRRRALRAVGGILAGSLAGCTAAGQVFRTYRHERDAPTDAGTLSPWRWRTLAYDARRSGYTPYGWLPSTAAVDVLALTGETAGVQPAFVEGTAYFSAREVEYEGLRVTLGASGLRAMSEFDDGWFFPGENVASPTVVGNAVLVTSDGMTRALDCRDGTRCWEYHEGNGHPTASPTVVDGTAYVTGERVSALAARTGEVRWATNRLKLSPRGTAATANGVFATTGGGGEGKVYRFDTETGEREWATSVDGELRVPPVVGGKLLYVVEIGGRLRALTLADGSEVWSRDLSGRSTAMPAVKDDAVFAVTTDDSSLTAFDAITGEVRWQILLEGTRATGPTVAGDAVYLPTSVEDGGLVHVLSVDSGRVRELHELPQKPTTPLVIGIAKGIIGTSPVSARSRLYVLSQPKSDG